MDTKTWIIILLILIAYMVFINHIYRKTLCQIISWVERINQDGMENRFFYKGFSTGITRKTADAVNKLMDRFMKEIGNMNRLKSIEKKTIANLSHDIKTPLTSLLGFVEVLHQKKTLTEQEKKEYLDIIYKKTSYLYHLIQQFFDFSRIESEDYTMHLQSIDLCSEIRDGLVLYYDDFKIHQLQPVLDIPDKPLFVMADRECLKRVLENLISNVIKYGCDGGVIGVSVKQLESETVLTIWDHGQGIPAVNLKYIFDRLYTVDASRNRSTSSTGLGLSISRLLVDKMGGKITLNSIVNKGTSVKITFISSK